MSDKSLREKIAEEIGNYFDPNFQLTNTLQLADQILSLIQPELKLISDEEIDHVAKVALQEFRNISWSQMCDWFSSSYRIDGEQAVLRVLSAVAQAQLDACKKQLGAQP